MNKKTPSF